MLGVLRAAEFPLGVRLSCGLGPKGKPLCLCSVTAETAPTENVEKYIHIVNIMKDFPIENIKMCTCGNK